MDASSLRDASSEEDILTSLDEIYTDFDQWIVKVSKFFSKSCREPLTEETGRSPENNVQKFDIIEFLVHGIFLQKTPSKHLDRKLRTICDENDSFVSNDHVILCIMKKSKYMRSKL